jgi:guanylate kinase
LQDGRDVFLRTDVQGARTIKKAAPGALTIFIAPPSSEELERRLRERGGDTEEQVELRLATAKREMDQAADFDCTVVNDDLAICVEEVLQVTEAERTRPGRPQVVLV